MSIDFIGNIGINMGNDMGNFFGEMNIGNFFENMNIGDFFQVFLIDVRFQSKRFWKMSI